jgi:hypothetical protein
MPKMKAGIKGRFAAMPKETTFEVHNLQK